jgi:putative intracellular protease/amidase
MLNKRSYIFQRDALREDGLLITGQNPASSKLVAEKLLQQLNAKKIRIIKLC